MSEANFKEIDIATLLNVHKVILMSTPYESRRLLRHFAKALKHNTDKKVCVIKLKGRLIFTENDIKAIPLNCVTLIEVTNIHDCNRSVFMKQLSLFNNHNRNVVVVVNRDVTAGIIPKVVFCSTIHVSLIVKMDSQLLGKVYRNLYGESGGMVAFSVAEQKE